MEEGESVDVKMNAVVYQIAGKSYNQMVVMISSLAFILNRKRHGKTLKFSKPIFN